MPNSEPPPVTETPVGYIRSVYTWRNEGDQPLTDADAVGLLGSQLTITVGGGAHIAVGTVTNAAILDDGARMQVTVEVGGRCCTVCGHVYPADTDRIPLAAVGELQHARPGLYKNPLYDNLPVWAPICTAAADCLYRRMDH